MPRKKPLNPQQKASEEWFRDLLKKSGNKKISGDYNKGERRKIAAGSMIFFSYPNPKTDLKVLKFFDAQPLAIIFNIRANYIHAINLHWTPRPMREIIIKMVVKINQRNIKQDRRMELDWASIAEFLRKNGLAHVITKTYITKRMANVTYIPYSQWKYAASLPTEKFVMDGSMSEDDLNRMIYSHAKATRSGKNQR